MFDKLNKYELPVKYAILCSCGGLSALVLANIFGLNRGGATYMSTLIATGIGGAIGGWLRQRKGKDSYARNSFSVVFALRTIISPLTLFINFAWKK